MHSKQVEQQLLGDLLKLDDDLLKRIEEFNRDREDSKKIKVIERSGVRYAVIDNNFIEFFRAQDLRERYEIRVEQEQNGSRVFVAVQKRDRKIGVGPSYDSQEGFGAELSVQTPELGKIAVSVGSSQASLNANAFRLEGFRLGSVYPKISAVCLGILCWNDGRFGLSLPTFSGFLDFFIAMSITPLQEAFSKGSFQEGLLHFLGVTDEVRDRFIREGILGGIIGFGEEWFRRAAGVFGRFLESIDEIRFLLTPPSSNWKYDNPISAVVDFQRAMVSTMRGNFREAEYILQGLLSSKDIPIWLRATIMEFEHKYWQRRTQPFSSLSTALDFIFNSHVPSQLGKRLDDAEKYVESVSFEDLKDDEEKDRYIANLMYVMLSNRDFDPKKMIESISLIVMHLARKGDYSTILALADLLNQPFRLSQDERVAVYDALMRANAGLVSIENNQKINSENDLAAGVGIYIFAKALGFEGWNLTDLRTYVPDELRESLEGKAKEYLKTLKSLVMINPKMIGYFLYELQDVANILGREELAKELRSLQNLRYNPGFGLSEIAERSLKHPIGLLIDQYDRESYRIPRLLQNIREFSRNNSEDIYKQIEEDLDFLARNPYILWLARILSDSEDYKKLELLIQGRSTWDKELDEGANRFIEERARRNTTPLEKGDKEDTTTSTQTDNSQRKDYGELFGRSEQKQEILRVARMVANGIRTIEDKYYLDMVVDLQKRYGENVRDMFIDIFGQSQGQIIYELYTTQRKLWPNIDPYKYVAAIIYELDRRMT
ncbi:MAG: hypothetical protein QXE47_02425 [Candidatus Anstonellales archaeon]